MKMVKFLLFAIIAAVSLSSFIEAAPGSVDLKAPVRYDGAQLWNVHLANDETKHKVIGLEENFGKFCLW